MELNLIRVASIPARWMAALAFVFCGLTTAFGSSFMLQGQSKGTTNWISSNLQGWHELDLIPCRIYVTGGPISNQVLTVTFPHLTGTTPGFQDLGGLTTSSNITLGTSPVLLSPPSGDWSYTLTVTLTDVTPGYIQFYTRLAAGAHLNVGSSLMIGGSPSSMGELQIHKPSPGPGAPNLAITKSGPLIASPGETIVYTLSYTNTASTNTAVGTQISDRHFLFLLIL
jgi:hypothetical protein